MERRRYFGNTPGVGKMKKIKPHNYSMGVMCLTCGNNGNCELGKHGDKGCCDLYTDGGSDDA